MTASDLPTLVVFPEAKPNFATTAVAGEPLSRHVIKLASRLGLEIDLFGIR
jgi:hypothetical protein